MRLFPKTEVAAVDRREDPRLSVNFRTVVIESDVFGDHVEIINIARLGFLAKATAERETGTLMRLRLPYIGRIEAMVVWCADGLLGARFLDAIDERSFDEFLHTLT